MIEIDQIKKKAAFANIQLFFLNKCPLACFKSLVSFLNFAKADSIFFYVFIAFTEMNFLFLINFIGIL